MAKPTTTGATGAVKKAAAQVNKGLTGAARATAAKATGAAKKAAAPGQMKKAAGVTGSAKSFTKGFAKKAK